MTQEELTKIIKLIQKDEREGNLDDLIKLRDYLNQMTSLEGKTTIEERIFDNPLLEAKREILLTPMEDYFDEIKQIGPPSATYPLKNILYRNFLWKRSTVDASFAVERKEQRPGQILISLAHFIQLKEHDVKRERGVGVNTFNTYQQFLEEKGLSFDTEISIEENQRIAKQLMKNTQSTNAPYKVIR